MNTQTQDEYLKLGETTQEQIFAQMLFNPPLFRKCREQLSFKYFTNPDLAGLVKIAFDLYGEMQTVPTVESIRARINASYFGADHSRRLRSLLDQCVETRDEKALSIIISELKIWKIAIVSKTFCLAIVEAHNKKKFSQLPGMFQEAVQALNSIDFEIEESKIEAETSEPVQDSRIACLIEYLISKVALFNSKECEDLKRAQLNFKIGRLNIEDQNALGRLAQVVYAQMKKENGLEIQELDIGAVNPKVA